MSERAREREKCIKRKEIWDHADFSPPSFTFLTLFLFFPRPFSQFSLYSMSPFCTHLHSHLHYIYNTFSHLLIYIMTSLHCWNQFTWKKKKKYEKEFIIRTNTQAPSTLISIYRASSNNINTNDNSIMNATFSLSSIFFIRRAAQKPNTHTSTHT